MSVSEYVRFFKKIIRLVSSFLPNEVDLKKLYNNKPSRFYSLCPKYNYDIDKTLETIVLELFSKKRFQLYFVQVVSEQDFSEEEDKQECQEIINHMMFTYVLRFVGFHTLCGYNMFPIFKQEFIDIVRENYMENYEYDPNEPEDYTYEDEEDKTIDENDEFYLKLLQKRYPINAEETYGEYNARLVKISLQSCQEDEESDDGSVSNSDE